MARPTAPTQPVSAAHPVQHPQSVERRIAGVPRLSVVVVNYRQWERTADLVRQLLATAGARHGDVEIVIVDNHSPPHPIARRLRRLPGVSVRRWESNRGFARAVNEGCRLSQGEWFLLLNPDTTLADGFLDGVLGLADQLAAAEPKAGIVGFHLHNTDGTRQLSAGPFPALASTLCRLALPRSRRKYQTPRAPERCRVPWVTGCCLLLRRACLQELGGLDEDFFLYYEDVDLCLRARQHGWSVWYEPNLAVVHHNPLHRRTVPAVLRMVTRHSLLTYATKHWPRWQFRLLCRIVRTEAAARRLWAWWASDAPQGRVFAEMSALAAELARGEQAAAQDRITRAIRAIDVRIGV
jgi:N-acetylglucosaminyl-diphospho-decaprenol L-rhamnosyltransferase